MEKEPTTKKEKSPSLLLIKITSIILISRECLTLLYAYVIKSNAQYGLNQPDEKFEARIETTL